MSTVELLLDKLRECHGRLSKHHLLECTMFVIVECL